MTINQNVINDLLPVYLAGDASQDTVSIIDGFLRTHPELARTIAVLSSNPLPASAAQPTREKEVLDRTRQLLHWRGILLGVAVFLTMLPFSFRFDSDGITWTFLQDAPPLYAVFSCVGAALAWTAFLNLRRRLASTGL